MYGGCCQPDILDNPVFMAALESVISGMLPVRFAAEKFGIRETSLVSAVVWTSVEPCDSTTEEDKPQSTVSDIVQAISISRFLGCCK